MKVKLLLDVSFDGYPTEMEELLALRQLLQDIPEATIVVIEAERIPDESSSGP